MAHRLELQQSLDQSNPRQADACQRAGNIRRARRATWRPRSALGRRRLPRPMADARYPAGTISPRSRHVASAVSVHVAYVSRAVVVQAGFRPRVIVNEVNDGLLMGPPAAISVPHPKDPRAVRVGCAPPPYRPSHSNRIRRAYRPGHRFFLLSSTALNDLVMIYALSLTSARGARRTPPRAGVRRPSPKPIQV